MLKTPSILLAFTLTFCAVSLHSTPPEKCTARDRIALSLLGLGVISFIGSIIAIGLSWSDFQVYQSCGAQGAQCCTGQSGHYTCTPSQADGPCASNQQLLCGANMTEPDSVRPAWKFPLGVASAVILGVSGIALTGTSCLFCLCIFAARTL